MKIEVGKAYRARGGSKVSIVEIDVDDRYPVVGELEGEGNDRGCWTKDGFYYFDEIDELDLISPWEDSQTQMTREQLLAYCADRMTADDLAIPAQIKSESKMDVSIGDRAMVECAISDIDHAQDMVRAEFGPFGHIWMSKDRLKSVEPAPPGVGDTVTWGMGQWTVLGVDGEAVWVKEIPSGARVSSLMNSSGFRILKRAGGE